MALVGVVAAVPPGYAAEVSFNKDVAPIIWSHCSTCHRPGELAPFSLIEYSDIAPRARQIVAAIKSHTMPPWLPEPGYGDFVNPRRLTQEEIDRIATVDFDSSERQRQLMVVLARVVAAEMDFRARDAGAAT